MIHTDGRPTIANAYALEHPLPGPLFEVVAELSVDVTDEPLAERSYAGVDVWLYRFGDTCVLRVSDADGEHEVVVPSDRALDAFKHPYVYLAR